MDNYEKYDAMVGIGCGYPEEDPDDQKKHSHRMPIDTALYLMGAEKIRREEGREKAALVFADIEVHHVRVAYRRIILEGILRTLGITDAWRILPQTEINRINLGTIRLSSQVPTQSFAYYLRELEDVRSVLNRKEALKRAGKKIGWALHNGKKLVGGEKHFDQEIEMNWKGDYDFAYLAAGVPLVNNFGPNKCPYLVRKREENSRILIPRRSNELERELNKMDGDVTQEGIDRIREFCEMSLNESVQKDPRALKEALEASLKRYLEGQDPTA